MIVSQEGKQVLKEYVSKEKGLYRIVDSRVSLDSVVYAFWRGETAESIAQSFPVLTLEKVYGALAFYLAHKLEVDEYIKQGDAEFEKLRTESREKDPMFYKKFAELRKVVA